MSGLTATANPCTPCIDALSQGDPHTHVVTRTGAPPLRFIGYRVFHRMHGGRASELFVSLWRMRNPGYILAHSLPDHGIGARAATRVPDVEAAIETLTGYCTGLTRRSVAPNQEPFFETALEATMTNARIEAFRRFAGQVLAAWQVETGEVAHKNGTRER